MSLESDLFKRMECDFTRLKKFGFVKHGHTYIYQTELASDDMTAVLEVDEKGQVSGRVLDAFGEEYIAIHLSNQKGSYTSKIRTEYLAVLQKAAKACFHPVPFLQPQANRISHLIKEKYHVAVEFPFHKYPHIGAWYHPENRKWFGLVLAVDGTAVGQEKGEIEILNLKCDSGRLAEYLQIKGIHESYHMSKKSWISIMLDDTLTDEEIMTHVEESYQLTLGGSVRHGVKQWIIPANPAYFDIDHAFAQTDTIHWKQTAKMQIGDLVYLYYGAPYSEIRYLCRVTAVDIPADIDGRVRIKKMMKIQRLYFYKDDLINRRVLKKYGVVSVRGPRFIPEGLMKEIERLYPDSIQ